MKLIYVYEKDHVIDKNNTHKKQKKHLSFTVEKLRYQFETEEIRASLVHFNVMR
jgi:hypothetical protein